MNVQTITAAVSRFEARKFTKHNITGKDMTTLGMLVSTGSVLLTGHFIEHNIMGVILGPIAFLAALALLLFLIKDNKANELKKRREEKAQADFLVRLAASEEESRQVNLLK